MSARQQVTLSDLWQPYLEAHSLPTTRAVHYVATVWGVGWSLAGFFMFNLWFILAAIVGGYTLAAGSHFIFERRKGYEPWKPLVFPHTVLAAGCAFRMFYMAVTGRLGGELQRLEIGRTFRAASHDTVQSESFTRS